MTTWDARYDQEAYFFGTEPAAFLTARADVLPSKSRVLCVADGEGRNSVYLASLGHDVTAFDASPVALKKARTLAGLRNLTIDFQQSGVEDWDWTKTYDAVIGVFVQFLPPPARDVMLQDMAQAVRAGGLMLLHGYAPRQVGYGTGGPPAELHMYTEDQLSAAFDGWDILRLEDYDAHIQEGTGHAGNSALVDLIARKPD